LLSDATQGAYEESKSQNNSNSTCPVFPIAENPYATETSLEAIEEEEPETPLNKSAATEFFNIKPKVLFEN